MTELLLVASATLLASFLCSLFEAALYAITPSQIEVLRAARRRGAELLARQREDVEEPIAAILTVNTIAHTLGATWCGAIAAERFGSRAVGIFAAVFTFLVLVATEIIPKSLGVRHAARLGPSIAWGIQAMVWLVWPLARPARAMMRLIAGSAAQKGPTEDEVWMLAKLAARGGGVRPEEVRWVQNALALDGVRARDIMTPRPVVEFLTAETTVEEAVARGAAWVHSRVPLTENGDPDRIAGIVHRREVFDAALLEGGGTRPLREVMRPLRFVPETMRGHELLRLFLRRRDHIVGVLDEYGGFEGLVALEDVLESLLGQEIVDEHDHHADLQLVARDRSPLADQAPSAPPTAPPEGDPPPPVIGKGP